MHRLRQATSDDILVIRAIAHAAWPVAYSAILSSEQLAYMLELMYSEAALLEQVSVKGHRFLLAEREGTAIGFAGFEHGYRSTKRTRLHKLYVLPEVKGTGAGAELLRAVESTARSAGDERIELNVNRFNPSKDWYLRRGFVIERDEVLDIGQGHVMDDHVMVKDLA
ncbi:MAG: GNAT family N-acetyltransferase [Flavobacteriales bacterium]|jgi:GNAT superfamily N-acetyltransferase|nr:GNAT family N-acetyltransferase [Flavobacteriales bacterium]